MIRSIRRLVAVAALSIGALAMPAMPAQAITGGQPDGNGHPNVCLLYTSPSPRDRTRSRMPSSA